VASDDLALHQAIKEARDNPLDRAANAPVSQRVRKKTLHVVIGRDHPF